MANEVLFPYLLPVSFTKMVPVEIPQYVSRFMDKYRFRDTIRTFEEKVCYIQQWLPDDSVRIQIISNYGPAAIQVRDVDGNAVGTPFVFDTRQQDYFRPGYFIRECEIDLQNFDPGYYYFELTIGGSDVWVSEPQEIATELPNTLYAEYTNYERYGEVIFDTGYSPAIRLPLILKFKAPGSKDTLYEDQSLNQTMVKAVPYRLWDAILGDAKGVPPWLANKWNWLLGCSDLRLDGVYYTKNEGAALEINEAELYPMAGYTIEMREKFNRGAVYYEDATIIVGKNSMMAVMDTKGFGIDDNGGDFLEYTDVN